MVHHSIKTRSLPTSARKREENGEPYAEFTAQCSRAVKRHRRQFGRCPVVEYERSMPIEVSRNEYRKTGRFSSRVLDRCLSIPPSAQKGHGMDKLTEGLKFLEDHTKSFFSDLERISLTVLLLYLAAPNAIVTAYLYLQGVIASALSVVTKLLQVDELDHSTHVILNLV
jgi:hypothetical protein